MRAKKHLAHDVALLLANGLRPSTANWDKFHAKYIFCTHNLKSDKMGYCWLLVMPPSAPAWIFVQIFLPQQIFLHPLRKNTLFQPNWFVLVEPSHHILKLESHTFVHASLHHWSKMAACLVIPASVYDTIHDNQRNLTTTIHTTEQKHNNNKYLEQNT